jgi:hypothetical protein
MAWWEDEKSMSKMSQFGGLGLVIAFDLHDGGRKGKLY